MNAREDQQPFFSRGKGPLVSILIPTRGRPDSLKRAVDSLIDLAENPEQVDFVFKVDDDDPGTFREISSWAWKRGGYFRQTICSGRGKGFSDINTWLDQMSALAAGDWLFVFTDDAEMLTPGWDRVLELSVSSYPWPGIDDVCLIVPGVETNIHGCDFPILRRKTWELLGSWGPIPYADAWVHVILRGILGTFLCPPISVGHHKPVSTPLMGADVRPPLIRYHSPTTDLIWRTLRDAARLTSYIDACRNRMRWTQQPAPGWHWWRKNHNGEQQLTCVGKDKWVTLVKEKGGPIDAGKNGNAEMVSLAEMGGEWCSIR